MAAPTEPSQPSLQALQLREVTWGQQATQHPSHEGLCLVGVAFAEFGRDQLFFEPDRQRTPAVMAANQCHRPAPDIDVQCTKALAVGRLGLGAIAQRQRGGLAADVGPYLVGFGQGGFD